ncbi:hypothetical protein Cgig2_023743 [Carnegiea gigantea]|uniref:DUF4283 domain-containing protein n=1 Tax=Carnegiea gigantea TaxID=171969 RepID=A0A9Q1GPK8_9CARY|nr:hypothetical protein Cgig2_023743 [Carnegiea gigantea]
MWESNREAVPLHLKSVPFYLKRVEFEDKLGQLRLFHFDKHCQNLAQRLQPEKIDKVPVWIQFPDLDLKYWSASSPMTLNFWKLWSVDETWYSPIQAAPMFKVFKKLQLLQQPLRKFYRDKFGDEKVQFPEARKNLNKALVSFNLTHLMSNHTLLKSKHGLIIMFGIKGWNSCTSKRLRRIG